MDEHNQSGDKRQPTTGDGSVTAAENSRSSRPSAVELREMLDQVREHAAAAAPAAGASKRPPKPRCSTCARASCVGCRAFDPKAQPAELAQRQLERARERSDRRAARAVAGAGAVAPIAPPPAAAALQEQRIERERERRRAVPLERVERKREHDAKWHAQRLEREQDNEQRWRARFAAKWGPVLKVREEQQIRKQRKDGDGGDLIRELVVIPRKLWQDCWAMYSDDSGRAAWKLWAPVPAVRRAIMMRVAFGLVSDGRGGRHARYDFSDARARAVATLAYALHVLSTSTRRRGVWGGGAVLGVTRGAFCHLLRNMKSRKAKIPGITTVFGTHRPGATLEQPGQLGYMTALKKAGYCYSRQLPSAEAEPCERWGVYTSARYQVASSEIEHAARFIGLDGALLELATTWTRDGLEAALTALERPPPLAPA